MELFTYLLKSAAILGLFYLVYWFALRRQTLFIANRHYLAGGILAALCLPLIQFTQTQYLPMPQMEETSMLPLDAIPLEAAPTVAESAAFDWMQVLIVLYVLGVVFSVGRFCYHSWTLLRVLKKGRYNKIKGYYHVQTNQQLAPFSFFKYLVYNPLLHSQQDLEMIIQHEKAHARGWHSLDVLLGNLLTVIHWLNPLAWWYKKSMIQNLEFIADKETVREIPSKKAYQLALVKASTQGQHLVLSNSFYQSFIKNRIVMLNTNQSHKANRWRLLLIVPLLAFFMYSFNVEDVVEYVDETTATSTPIYQLYADLTDTELDQLAKQLTQQAEGVEVSFDSQKRDAAGQLTFLGIVTRFNGNEHNDKLEIKGPENGPITAYDLYYEAGPRIVVRSASADGVMVIATPNELIVEDPELRKAYNGGIKAASVLLTGEEDTLGSAQKMSLEFKGTKEDSTGNPKVRQGLGENPLYVINGKVYKADELPADKKIVTDGSMTFLTGQDATAKYGEVAADGVIEVNGTANFEDETQEETASQVIFNTEINKDMINGSQSYTGELKSNTYTPTVNGFKRQSFGGMQTATGISNRTRTYSGKVRNDITIVITADMSEAQLEEKTKYLKDEYDLDFTVKNIERDAQGKITAISIVYSKDGSSGVYNTTNNGEPISDITITLDKDGGIMAGNIGNQSMADRKAQIEMRKKARAMEMEARKLARENEMMARKVARQAEMKARQAELAAMKAEMAAMSEEQKAEMRAEIEARKAEMASMTEAQKAEMQAKIAELKAKEKAMMAQARASGYSSGNYARVSSIKGYVAGSKRITKNTTDAELAQLKKDLAAENVSFTYKRVRRNDRGQITGIKITLDNNKGSKSSSSYSGAENGIDPIEIDY